MISNIDSKENEANTSIIGPFRLVRTCHACPEQYDVFLDEQQVAYFRLRHGWLTATVPDVGGKEVYEATPDGDGLFCDYERDKFLRAALVEVARYLNASSVPDGNEVR